MGSIKDPADRAVAMLRVHRERDRLFGNDMFGNLAWELMLALYNAQGPRPITDLVCQTGQSPVLVGRWLDALVSRGVVVKTKTLSLSNYDLSDNGRDKLSAVLCALFPNAEQASTFGTASMADAA